RDARPARCQRPSATVALPEVPSAAPSRYGTFMHLGRSVTMKQATAASVYTVDADGHVLEPRDTWLKYLEPRYRERAIRIDHDAKGNEVLLIDGKSLEAVHGRLAALGGVEM